MKVAVFGKAFTLEARPYMEALHKRAAAEGFEIRLYKRLDRFLRENCEWGENYATFENYADLQAYKPDFLFTIGGDGTILDAATLIRNLKIPVVGINTGRLGFLANIARNEINRTIDHLLDGKYSIDSRQTIMLSTGDGFQPQPNFALNEVTVSRKGTTSMITVHADINGKYLNSYWADGLIVSTATGSTGYSLSCGGPIIMPDSQNFVITPIAPHNLNVRPIVISNDCKIRLKIDGRENEYLASLDSRIYSLSNDVELFLQRSEVEICLVQLPEQDFATTLRNKLLWGLDRRN